MILVGDVRKLLTQFADGSVNCVVTSPPYWGLRDYGTAFWDGGDAACDHIADASKTKKFGNPVFNQNRPSREATKTDGYFFKDTCGKCGATRVDSQIGLEQTPGEYVDQLVSVFREVRRVLRDDGTLWLNLGDSYAGSGKGGNPEGSKWSGFVGNKAREKSAKASTSIIPQGLKPKDLVGIPWRVAFALQADGWYLRQDIIWHKPNPMPESVTDRCTKSHEYLFLLTKSTKYYYDQEAIKEPSANLGETSIRFGGSKYGDSKDPKHATKSGNNYVDSGTRNKRSVWTVATKPFKDAHFATFPPQLIEPCILAGCPENGTVLDPFFGAGTTGLVAQRHNRRWIGCELNPEIWGGLNPVQRRQYLRNSFGRGTVES
jgi:DNA modification methylase